MELSPVCQILGLFSFSMEAAAGFVWCLLIGVVVMGDAFGSKVMAGEIDQFPADLKGGKVEKMTDRLNFCGEKCTVPPVHAVLKDITGLFPTAKITGTVKDFPGEPQKAVAGMVQQRFPGGWITGICQVNQPLKLRVCAGRP